MRLLECANPCQRLRAEYRLRGLLVLTLCAIESGRFCEGRGALPAGAGVRRSLSFGAADEW
jgi:hypothetical protein